MESYITKNLLHGIFKLSEISFHQLYTTTEFILKGAHPDIIQKIEQIDILNKIKIIEAFITECHDNPKYNMKRSVEISITSIHNILVLLEKELKKIKEECEYHKTKYFSYWRYPNCSENVERVINYSVILDKRLEFLQDIIKLIY